MGTALLCALAFGVPIGWIAAWFVHTARGGWRSLLFAFGLVSSALATVQRAGVGPMAGAVMVLAGAGIGVLGYWAFVTHAQGGQTGRRPRDGSQSIG
ncbi:hypothetical protein N825_22880 [Skermanella stibiiresistens SB22]|uniref:Uncharacterized protein n=1 Tax=Skermanella stibiiresistens SB22 TaxID=1385369 RepID=W9GSU0_9PROT|nr:hypothetical protein N825_22880 [Skermanella stibiiresistens SB22]